MLPITSAVTAASSATGRSDVPAAATSTTPVPAGMSFCCRVIALARLMVRRAGATASTASNAAGSARVTSSVLPPSDDALGDTGDLGGSFA